MPTLMEARALEIHIEDSLDPARATALQAALGEGARVVAGAALPPFYHQLYFWDPQPPRVLGRDGHPKTGGIIPDYGLPRRMWAGGRLSFHRALVAGTPARKTTHLESTAKKTGRSGKLAFVTLRHDISQNGALCVTEFQELVYREAQSPAQPNPQLAPTDETFCEEADFDSTLLFRYSALTFNGHRIHFDNDYARGIEGYRGLVVHGPLLAHLLMRLAARELGSLKTFRFRATAPLILGEPASLCWKAGELWVRGPAGRLVMTAQAT